MYELKHLPYSEFSTCKLEFMIYYFIRYVYINY